MTESESQFKSKINLFDLIVDQIDGDSDDEKSKKSKSNRKIFDPFDCPEDDDLPNLDLIELRKSMGHESDETKIICQSCQVKMLKSGSEFYECPECGWVEKFICGDEIGGDSDIASAYNTSDSSSIQVRISGPGSHAFQKKLMVNTSNYKKTQKKNTIDQFLKMVNQYQGPVPPKNIILESCDLYYEIQQFAIKRGNVRKGTMLASLAKICENHGIMFKPKEFASMFGISQGEYSAGVRAVEDYLSAGRIALKEPDTPEDPELAQINAFLNRYFESLNIPDDSSESNTRPKYKEFAQKLIRFTLKYRISESSVISSRCAGSIYLLSLTCPELNLQKDAISKECSISKSTYLRFYQAVNHVINGADPEFDKVKKRLRHLFKKYKIPLPH